VGVPKTIDNDIPGTDVTFGFDTAVQIATEAIDRITTTAESHDRVMVVEVMGRTCGWIANVCRGRGRGGRDPRSRGALDLSELADLLRARVAGGRRYSVVVVAEGIAPPPGAQIAAPLDAFGFERLGGVSAVIAAELERLTGFEARVTVLGHVQRGGTPSAADRVLGSRLGVAAADLAVAGAFGRMVSLRGTEIVDVPLDVVRANPRAVPPAILDVARVLAAP
jgi:6-phosphofructokinase 1